MKKIGKNSFVNAKNVNGAFINEKQNATTGQNEFSVCFKMAVGEPQWSDKFDVRETAEQLVYSVLGE